MPVHSTARRCVAALATTAALAGASPASPASPASVTRACTEDSPCWNWATMGNHKRGITTIFGIRHVVGPCRFRKLMLSGVVDYRVSDVMLGDFTAMRTRCPR